MNKYITIEGLEGVGKTFFVKKLKNVVIIPDDDLDDFENNVIDNIRVKDPFFRNDNPLISFLCFTAVDLHIFERKVKNNLLNNNVVQDRGVDTTCLYSALQMAEEDREIIVSFKELFEIRKKLFRIPDLTIVLIDDFEKCIKRAEERNGKKYSKKEVEFLKMIDKGFKLLIKEFPDRIKFIDKKGKSDEEILEEINLMVL